LSMSNTHAASLTVAYLDFEGVLFDRDGSAWRARDVLPLLSRLGKDHRLGLLCNLPPRYDAPAFRLLLRDHGFEAWFDPELILLASALPTPLPDRRAFAVAAALAEAKPDALLYITANPKLSAAAEESGWHTAPPSAPAATVLAGVDAGTETRAPQIFAEVVDEDTGATFILRGRIVTLDASNRVLSGGKVIIRKGKIAAVLEAAQAVPTEFANVALIDTGATLYPGLIDLHNHMPYNVAPLWKVPRHYTNRNQWRSNADYKLSVANPVVALAQHTPTAKALVRYVEAKALVGGVTTGQGMRMKEQGVTKHFVGAMRNVETTDDPRLPEAATRVPDINPNRPEDVDSFRRNLDRATAFFYHMSEGTDDAARRHFLNLKDNDLLGAALVGIHALGLQRADLDELAAKGGKVVWSPLSNLLLYGATVKLKDLLESGVNFSLGCDWSPSGSKNPLLELKVARWVAQQQGAALTARDLVGLVCDRAAGVVGWGKHLGSLAAGKFADILAITGEQGDPFEHLINARERQVQLVIVHGEPRYGDATLMQALQSGPATQLESVMIDGAAKRFFLQHPLSTLNDLPFNTARDRLQDTMNDLKSFVQQTSWGGRGLSTVGAAQDSFRLVLDMQDEQDGDASGFADAALLAVAPNDVAGSVVLDPVAVNDPIFWNTMSIERNLPAGLVAAVQPFYS
jgi:5-methylthioadenosine/S-adenosylhomocysteine deaminase